MDIYAVTTGIGMKKYKSANVMVNGVEFHVLNVLKDMYSTKTCKFAFIKAKFILSDQI